MSAVSAPVALANDRFVVFDTAAWDALHPASGFAIGTHGATDRPVLGPVENGRFPKDDTRLVPVPESLADERAVMIPLVVEALRVCDSLQLEIGTAALITVAQPWAPLFEVVSSWYGAFPIRFDAIHREPTARDDDPVSALRGTLAHHPAVGVVELTGRSDIVDTVLESIPSSSRVMFAGPRRDRLTIDYYVNVHRKGLHLHSTILSPSRLFTAAERDLARVERAGRLLSNDARARACMAAVEASSHQR